MWGAALILAIGSVMIALTIRSLDMHEFNEALLEKSLGLATLAFRGDQLIDVSFTSEYMPEFEREVDAEYFEFHLPDGTTIARSASLGNAHLPFKPVVEFSSDASYVDLVLPDGRRGRMIQICLTPHGRNSHPVQVDDCGKRAVASSAGDDAFVVLGLAHELEEVYTLLIKIYITLGIVDVLLLALIYLVVQKALKKGFTPIAAMNEQIRSLQPESLDRRIHLPSTPEELQPVLLAMNSFIKRLQAAFTRERSFTSNVAHELRTPVAEFRLACEVGSKWSDDPALVRKRFNELRNSAIGMEHTVNTLLELSRLDQGRVSIEKSSVVLSDIVNTSWSSLCTEAGCDGRSLKNDISQDVSVETDADKLKLILRNLIGNAITYSLPGTSISCSLEELSGGRCVLRISNPCDNLTPSDLEHMFERFWRKDSARTSGSCHTGLGLAIVRSLADVLNINIKVDLTDDSVFTVSLFLARR
jgi:two-component system sensor histidine kinase QseC